MKNIFAYTALGPSPAYCSINEDEQGVVIVTVRAKDGRESSVEIPKAEAALLQQGEPEGWKLVPELARASMKLRGGKVILDHIGDTSISRADLAGLVFETMLSASPLPPATSWKTVDSAPEGKMLVTYRQGEQEISAACVIRENHRGEPQEIWTARDGRDTITHGSYAAPTHWLCECPPLPPAPGAEMGERKTIPPLDTIAKAYDAGEQQRAHRIVTKEEYRVGLHVPKGWHEVCHNIDVAENVGIRFLGSDSSHQAVLEEASASKHFCERCGKKFHASDDVFQTKTGWVHLHCDRRVPAAIREEAFEEAAKLVKSFWIIAKYDHIGDADVLESVCAQASEAIRALATPPAEEETK